MYDLEEALSFTMPWEEQNDARRTRNLSYDSSEEWIRGVRAKVRRLTEEMPQQTQGNIRSHLQRVRLPNFSGEAEDWPKFRRFFLELTEKEGLPPAILMAQLREHLDTQEARAMIAGKTDPTEAWAALNSWYGDKELAMVNVMHKLAYLDTSEEEGYGKVEVLL